MTNKELQEKLKKFPDNLLVWYEDAEWGYQEVHTIEKDEDTLITIGTKRYTDFLVIRN